jgi:signal transduction histidine kinase
MINAPAIQDVVPPCPVYLTALRVMGQDRPITADVVIEDTEYDVVFAYGAVDYTAPAQVLYRVRLEGLDPDWSRPSAQRSTRYTNLACGAYTFLVQARNWGGTWSDSAALHFVVARSAQGRELDAARAQAEAAEAARAQAEAAVRVRNDVLGTVAHDLRAPLTGIMGRTDLLSHMVDRFPDVDHTRLRDHITALSAAATRMAGMIEEITDVIQLDMGQPLALTIATVDLAAVINAAVATVGLTKGRSGRRSDSAIDVTVETGLTVCGDAARLTRVVENIVSNAVKYSPAGGPVTVKARARGNNAVIVVQDHGVGIPANEVDRIFTPYFRASTAQVAPGTGLGLAGARAIVEQHGGTIQLHSVEGEGTTVTLTLPLGDA